MMYLIRLDGPAAADEVDEGAQRRRHVAAARVVRQRAAERLPPVLQQGTGVPLSSIGCSSHGRAPLFVFAHSLCGSSRLIARRVARYIDAIPSRTAGTHMTRLDNAGTFTLGDRTVKRIGYGAMQLAGPGVFGPPRDRAAAVAVLREAVERGVDHIDTSDFYGPHVTNQIIREALHPYRDSLTIVTKIGARRDDKGGWLPASTRAELTQAVHDNLRNLGLDVLPVVNLRAMFSVHGPAEGSLEEPLTALADLQRQGLVRHVGLSNVTRRQVVDGRRICQIVCVQNMYNLAHRADDALVDELATQAIAYVPFFPLGGFTPLQSTTLSDVAKRLGATPMQVALAWLLRRSPNLLLIPGTSSVTHLRENLAAVDLALSAEMVAPLDAMAGEEAAVH
jgi:pyridoxine 4-dehydrogenase